MTQNHEAITGRYLSLVAQVEVETLCPRYPLRTAHGVIHPVGHFVTTLCGPEIREAQRRDELRAIGPGIMYWTRRHMADWATWALRILDHDDPDTPEVARVCVKAWTRTVPGRWAGRTGRTVSQVEQPLPGWRLERTHTMPGRVPWAILDMAGTRYEIAQDQEMDNARPIILAWIQSYVRLRLSRLIDLIGEDAVVLCHTDGVIVDVDAWCRRRAGFDAGFLGAQGRLDLLGAHLDGWAKACAPLRPRVKMVTRSLEILSPQHVITDSDRQLSGVPRSADHLGEHRYAFTDWPKLATQLESEVELGYLRRRRVVDLSRVPVLRWVLSDGSTRPVTARGRLGEGSRLVPWAENGCGAAGGVLRAAQHPLLEGLR